MPAIRIQAPLLFLLLFQACQRPVDVPRQEFERMNDGGVCKVVLVDGREFVTKNIVVADSTVSFRSDRRGYVFAREDVAALERFERDTPMTIVAVTTIGVAVAWLWYIARGLSALGSST